MNPVLSLSRRHVYNVFKSNTLYYLLSGTQAKYMSDDDRKKLDILDTNIFAWLTMRDADEVLIDLQSATAIEYVEGHIQLFVSADRTKTVNVVITYRTDTTGKILLDTLEANVVYSDRRMGSDEKTYSGANGCSVLIDVKDLMDIYTTTARKELLDTFIGRMTERINTAIALLEQTPVQPKDIITTMPQYKIKQHPYLV